MGESRDILMQIDKDKFDRDSDANEKIAVGKKDFDVFDAALEGGLAVSFLSDSDVKTCAVFKFGDMEFEVVKANSSILSDN